MATPVLYLVLNLFHLPHLEYKTLKKLLYFITAENNFEKLFNYM